jgi:flagellar hook protein FlgE
MSFNTALSGLNAASADLDVISNNIANAPTAGFKSASAQFSDVYANNGGSSSIAIGMGVQMASVTQDFSNGDYTSTGAQYDFAINGDGFFTLNNNGTLVYSRNGHFQVNAQTKELTNDFGATVVGYLADYSVNPTGTIGSLVGNIVINATEIAPKQTTQAAMTGNLFAQDTVKTLPFMAGFTPTNPPNPNSFNYMTEELIYDSLGNEHTFSCYYVKEATVDQWQVFVGIDGTDVTPVASSQSPRPFTVVFDSKGQYIPNNPSIPPTVTSSAQVNGVTGTLGSIGSLTPLTAGDLVINGISVGATVADGVSSAQSNASALAIQNAINAAAIPGITTSIIPASVGLGVYNPPTPAGAFPAGALVINGVDLATLNGGAGVGLYPTAADLATAISTIPGLSATVAGGALTITATDGRNIEIAANGSIPGGANFASLNVATTGDYIERGTINVAGLGAGSVIVSGNAPLNAGLTSGTYYAQASYNSSDSISIKNWNPNNGAAVQSIALDLSGFTQYGEIGFASNGNTQNGNSAGRYTGVTISETGVIAANFDNQQKIILGQILLSRFNNVTGLQPIGNSMWAQTTNSGNAIQGTAQGSGFGNILGGQLEQSNVDITAQLVDLIIAQRNFQANAKSIQTEDAITQTIMGIQ